MDETEFNQSVAVNVKPDDGLCAVKALKSWKERYNLSARRTGISWDHNGHRRYPVPTNSTYQSRRSSLLSKQV